MPHFYFHVEDDRRTLDNIGVDLPDIEAARQEAIRSSGEMLRNGSGAVVWGGNTWRMWVTDQPDGRGRTFFTLWFSATEG